jgi:hypothetical protein
MRMMMESNYDDIIFKSPPTLKVPLSRSERAAQYLAFEAVLSGSKLLEMAKEIWLREYAPEDYQREVKKNR